MPKPKIIACILFVLAYGGSLMALISESQGESLSWTQVGICLLVALAALALNLAVNRLP